MSKFFATNNSIWYQRAKSVISKTPFKIAFEYDNNDVYALSTKKIQVDNINHYQKDDDFIIQTGTCAYKEESGVEVLAKILYEFTGDVCEVREQSLGNYGNLIFKNGKLYVFNEASGFYDIFYFEKDGKWFVGTTIVDIGRVLFDELTISKQNVMEELTRFAIFENGTYFNEVQRLSGGDYIVIDKTCVKVNKPELGILNKDIYDVQPRVKAIAEEMKRIARVMYKNFGQPTLGCTGGLDSRLCLAAYLAIGVKPRIAYGFGNSQVAESRLGDLEIDRIYKDRYGLELIEDSWNETEPLDKLWDKNIEQFGKLIYDGNEDALHFYTKDNEKFINAGYASEFCREGDWSRNIPQGEMTIEEYFWGFHAQCNRNIFSRGTEFKKNLLNKWKRINAEHGIGEHFNKEETWWLSLAYRQSADSHMVNLVNQYKYINYLMSENSLLKFNYVDFDVKYGGKFIIMILQELYPDILNVPFFTHCHKMIYNQEKMCVEELKVASFKNYLRPIARNLIPKPVRRIINNILKRGVAGSEYIDNVRNLLKKDGNSEKLRRLIGDDIYENLDINVNHVLMIRGIILCKTFESIGIEY